MATLIEAVGALLEPVAPLQVWYGINPTEPLALDLVGNVKPYITFQRVIGSDNVSLSGPSAMQGTRVQVDYFAPRINDAVALSKAGDAALLVGFTGTFSCIPLTSQDLFEEPVRLWRVSRDYSIWFIET
jgi:hypothetical protein